MGQPVLPVYYSKPVPLRQQIKNNRSGPFFHDRMFDHIPIPELKKKLPEYKSAFDRDPDPTYYNDEYFNN